MERAGTDAAGLTVAGGQLAGKLIRRFEKAYAELAEKDPHLAAFEFQLPDSSPQLIGRGQPRFKVIVNDRAGVRALLSLDETRIGASYLNGSIDITGELVAALRLRPLFSDRHPLRDLWSTWLHPLVFGQVKSDRKWIAEHYDEDPEFYTTWLDETRVYSQGVFESDDETLTTALRRKLDFAFDACRMKPGDRVLDIGGGWGAFTEYGGKRGLRVTSLTISKPSEDYINELIAREKLPCTVLFEHFLEHETDEKYDAIVNMGVTEHLPDYRATLAQYQKLLMDIKAGARNAQKEAYIKRDKINLATWAANPKLTAVQIPEKEMAEFRRIAGKPLWEEWVKENEGKLPARELLDLVLKTAAEASK